MPKRPLAVVFVLLSLSAAAAETPARKAVVVLAPPGTTAAPGCVAAEALERGELERLKRFAVLPNGFLEWQQRNCYPQRVNEPTLSRISHPVGLIVTIDERDTVIVDPGTAWLGKCAGYGLFPTGSEGVTGSDIVSLLDVIGSTPELRSEDLREIGLAKGRRRDGGNLYALYLGTPRRATRVECFEELPAMVSRAAEALRAGK